MAKPVFSAPRAPHTYRSVIIKQMGFPSEWHAEISMGIGMSKFRASSLLEEIRFQVSRDLYIPTLALLRAGAEGAIGIRKNNVYYRWRLRLISHVLRLALGIEYASYRKAWSPVISFVHPILRGGLIGNSFFRLDYMPWENHTWLIGLEFPLFPSAKSKLKPTESAVKLPIAQGEFDSDETAFSPCSLKQAAHSVYSLIIPPWGGGAPDFPSKNANPSFVNDTIRKYHTCLQQTFSLAIAGKIDISLEEERQGIKIAQKARENLLRYVLMPYDRLFGQRKSPDTILGMGKQAKRFLIQWCMGKYRLKSEQQTRVEKAFAVLVNAIECVRKESLQDARDGRLVWLPLQLGFYPEEINSKEEIENIIEEMIGKTISSGNRVKYLINAEYMGEVFRTIREAKEYHVLWVHDVAGVNYEDRLDEASFWLVMEYFETLAKRVEEYDQIGRMPLFIVAVDQWHYDQKNGRVWLQFLDDPLGNQWNKVPLKPMREMYFKFLEKARFKLAKAIENSHLLQQEKKLYGEKWLRNKIKIHVSITNRSTPILFTNQIVPIVGLPDDVSRDHRKIVFYDLSEDEPYRGQAIYFSGGIGEEYLMPGWEERAVLIQGPALRGLKAQARKLFLGQGFSKEEVPWVLQPHSIGENYWRQITLRSKNDSRFRELALDLHNQTGFDAKEISVARAVLLTLAPKQSIAIAPDSLWTNQIWARMLVGQALRGGKVLVIVPGIEAAASQGNFSLARIEELSRRLVKESEKRKLQLRAAGGVLRLGVFAPKEGSNDVYEWLLAAGRSLEKHPFLREIFNLGTNFDKHIARIVHETGTKKWSPCFSDIRRRLNLHLKINGLFLEKPSERFWSEKLEEYAERYLNLSKTVSDPSLRNRGLILYRQRESGDHSTGIKGWFLLGSANMDDRSLMLDGECAFFVSGSINGNAMVDLCMLALQCEWVQSTKELDKLLPPPGKLIQRIGKWIETLI